MDSNNNDSIDNDAKSNEDTNTNLPASHNNRHPLQLNLNNGINFEVITPNIDRFRILNNNRNNTLFAGNNLTYNNTPNEQLLSELTTIFYNALTDNNIPRTNVNEQFNNLLSQSFDEKSKYKTVLSEEGEKELKRVLFKDSSKTNTSCPIFCVDFEDDTEVTELPCKHIFISAGIEKWLKEENNKCPVCRYQLDSMEISVTSSEDYDYDNNNDGLETKDEDREDYDIEMEHADMNVDAEHTDADAAVEQPRSFNEIINNRQNLSTRELAFSRIINNIPHSYIQSIIENEESKQLDAAILASLRDLEEKKDDDPNNDFINNID